MNENHSATEQSLGPLAVNRFGDRFFFNLHRHSFDKISAEALFDAKFSDALFQEDMLNVVVGTDSGLLPRYVQNKTLPKGSRYIFVEPDEVLLALQEQGLLAGLDERIQCVGLQEWDRVIHEFKITDYFYINGVRSFNAICAQDDFIQQYAELSWHLAEVLSQLHWLNSIELGMEAFITRQMDNIADNRRPAALLKNVFRGKTVALLAGGPSLDEALPWVKANRSQLIVFAVSRISRQLLAANLEPDFVFSVDPTELSFDISKEMLKFSDKVNFICSYHTVPTLVNQWLGNMFYLGERLPWSSDLNVANLGSVGPTVTNTALYVAHQLGAKQVILAGVDLCFTREGFTHAKGSDEQLAGPRFNLTSLQVETNAGFLAPTSSDFAQAIKTLSAQAKLLEHADCEIVNVSAASAKIDNISYKPLNDIELDNEIVDVLAIVEAVSAYESSDTSYYRKVVTELKKAQFQVKAIAQLAETALFINRQMYNAEGLVVSFKDKQRLDKLEKKLRREYRQFSKLVKKFGIRRFIKLAKPFSDEDWTAEEARQLGDVYYQAYIEGTGKLLQLLDGAINRVAAREEEYAENPNFKTLIEQCKKDRSYGRVKRWRALFPAAQEDKEIEMAFTELDRLFAETIADQNTRHFARAKRLSDLTVVKQRAGLLFKHKKAIELADLQAVLGKQEKSQATIYRDLVTGYLAELRNEFSSALQAYQRIVDAGDILLEEALSRIASIGIDQSDMASANLALQCLSQMNPVYLPFYAEMQRLQGDVMAAIDAYNSYISQFHEDVSIQMKLAVLYADCKIYEGAEMMVDYILQQKPGLEAAVNMKRQLQVLKLSG